MALDLSGFNSGVQNYEGLYKVGDDVRQNKELDLRRQEMDFRNKQYAQNEADKESARKNATANYLKGFLNPAQFATGTIYDPIIDNGVRGIMGKAMGYASQGLDAPTISSLINQDVAKLSQTSQNLKQINAQAVNMKKLMSAQKGFDTAKFDDEFKNNTYFTTDDKGNKVLKDISQLDPQQDYADEVLRNGNVWNNQTVDDFLKNTKPLVYSSKIKERNAAGKMNEINGDISAPSFMMPDTNPDGTVKRVNGRVSFVPAFDIAKDGDADLIHNFIDGSAPVRTVTDDVWDHAPNNLKAYVLQEVRSHIKDNPNIRMTDPQAEILGKAIMYNELKNSPQNGGTFKQAATVMQPLPARNTFNINTAGAGNVVDYYNGDNNVKGVRQIVDEDAQKGYTYTRFNKLPSTVHDILLNLARKDDKNIDPAELYLTKKDDQIVLMKKTPSEDFTKESSPNPAKDEAIMPIDPLTLNVPANQSIYKVGSGKTKQETIGKVLNTSKEKSVPSKTKDPLGIL